MKLTSRIAVVIFLLMVRPNLVHAQDDLSAFLPKGVTPRNMLRTFLLAEAQRHFDARRTQIAGLKSAEDVSKRQTFLKGRFLEALGGFPEKTPLNARVVGKEQRDGYHIERVIYESRPDHHVTATLYIPDGMPPFPGVLMPIGHSANGKAADYIQRGSILLAKNGLAVLTYDPIGQGERRQLLDKQGKGALGNSTTEHTMIGVGALLVGESTATYRIWDGIRSLDYLASRPEIDPARLGCTGNSGGGTLTSYLMALDERIVAAAPSCYITSLEKLFATIGPQDAEQNITGQVAFGMEHADYLLLHAPRPTLICAATRDFFNIDGTWTTFREAMGIYGLLGHSERVGLVEYNTTHGYPKPQREAVTRWMRRWLLGKDDAPIEPAFAIAKDADLQCTRSGQVLEDFKGKSVFHLNAERADVLAKQRSRLPAPTDKQLLANIRKMIGVPNTINPAKQPPGKGRLVYETEPGIVVPGTKFASSQKPARALVLYVHDRDRMADGRPGGPISKLTEAGSDVLAVDLRGFGETASSPTKADAKPAYFGEFKESFLGLHLKRPLLGQRVYDLLALVEHVKSSNSNLPLHVVGIGTAGPIVLHAAALDPRIEQVTIENSIVSWSAVVRSPVSYNQLTNVVPGALGLYDLPDLARLIAPRMLNIHSSVDPLLQSVSQAVLDEVYAACRTTYNGQKAGKNLVLQAR